MSVADISRLGKRALRALNAAPNDNTYTDTPANNDWFPVKQEITDALLSADQRLLIAIVSQDDHYLRPDFLSTSSVILHGGKLPGSLGWWSDIELNPAADGSGAWSRSYIAESKAAILEMVEMQSDSIFGTATTDVYPWHWVESGRIYHTGGSARCSYISKAIGSACLCPENYEDIILYGGLASLRRVGIDPIFFDRQQSNWDKGLSLVLGNAKFIPPEQELERIQLPRAA